MRRKIAAGNWKMNGTSADLTELEHMARGLPASHPEVVICPPAPLLFRAAELARPHGIAIGAQDCHRETSGAHTGDISAAMIADTGASFVILGHSERRADHAETDTDVRAKARAAHAAGLTAIICVGEELEEYEADNTLDIIAGQLAGSIPEKITGQNTVIAYEPIWAIGTGKIPTPAEVATVHDFIRAKLSDRFGARAAEDIALLYGGSVKPDNAAELFAVENVDGFLVGGASLKAQDFVPIIAALAGD